MPPINIITGSAIPIIGEDIDTDRIIPARFLKEITFKNMGKYLFIDARHNNSGEKNDHPLNNPAYENASIMIVGRNFGCGSSREHAPQAIKRAGFKALIGESFSEIFSGNCLSLGIPTVTIERFQIEKLQAFITAESHTLLTLDLNKKQVIFNTETISFHIKEENRKALLSGDWDVKDILKSNMKKIKELTKSLPYMNGYT